MLQIVAWANTMVFDCGSENHEYIKLKHTNTGKKSA